MANKTRSDILSQLQMYVSRLSASTYDTMIDNLIDLAVEEISQRHDFKCLADPTPVEHDSTAGEYYIDESDFGFGAAATQYVDINDYTSTMTGNETFTYASYSVEMICFLDPGGANRTFNPSGAFPTGYKVKIINTGEEIITFDSSASAQNVGPGQYGEFIYDGSTWH